MNVTKDAPVVEGQQQEEVQQQPIFETIEGIDQNSAVNVLIQVAEMAQKAGVLGVRDSVILAKAIDVLRPGLI